INTKKTLLLLSCYLFGVGPARALEPSFEQWADKFAGEWVSTNPQFATRSQYFSGAEQDENDRQLVLGGSYGATYGMTAARRRSDMARRALKELGRFSKAYLKPCERTSAAVIE